MARRLEADIIIKGAGPVGLSMANLLGVYGIRTLVLEQNPTTVEEPRAIGLDVESGRALQSMGLEKITSADMIQGFKLDYLNAKGADYPEAVAVDPRYQGRNTDLNIWDPFGNYLVFCSQTTEG